MVGQRIRQVREAAGLTRAQVVGALVEAGLPATEAELASYEDEERLPGPAFLEPLVRVLGVTPALVMELGTLERLPRMPEPAGYLIRAYREGDAAEWCRLINESIGGPYDEAGFVEYQLVNRGVVDRPAGGSFEPDGLYFAENAGRVVGTACAIWRADVVEEKGYVHMVVVEPEHRGHGVGRALLVTALHHLRGRGFRRAALVR